MREWFSRLLSTEDDYPSSLLATAGKSAATAGIGAICCTPGLTTAAAGFSSTAEATPLFTLTIADDIDDPLIAHMTRERAMRTSVGEEDGFTGEGDRRRRRSELPGRNARPKAWTFATFLSHFDFLEQNMLKAFARLSQLDESVAEGNPTAAVKELLAPYLEFFGDLPPGVDETDLLEFYRHCATTTRPPANPMKFVSAPDDDPSVFVRALVDARDDDLQPNAEDDVLHYVVWDMGAAGGYFPSPSSLHWNNSQFRTLVDSCLDRGAVAALEKLASKTMAAAKSATRNAGRERTAVDNGEINRWLMLNESVQRAKFELTGTTNQVLRELSTTDAWWQLPLVGRRELVLQLVESCVVQLRERLHQVHVVKEDGRRTRRISTNL